VPPLTGLVRLELHSFPPLPRWATVYRPFGTADHCEIALFANKHSARTGTLRELALHFVTGSDAAAVSTFSQWIVNSQGINSDVPR
jgi:hypothetical protein